MINNIRKLYTGRFDSFMETLSGNLQNEKKTFVVTANPETLMTAEKNGTLNALLQDSGTVVVPDGIGLVKAARSLGVEVTEKIAGVEIAQKLMSLGDRYNKSIYYFGAAQEVVGALVKKTAAEYPNLNICGYSDGYVGDRDGVFEEIARLEPDIVLVALGIPHQELLIGKHLSRFRKGVFVGVGGSFDVLSGTKRRAPKIFRKLSLEWLYRILREPKRINRFVDSNVKFVFKVKALKKANRP